MLATTAFTVEAIANEIGYQNPFVFSNAFRKWIGFRPSEYRRKKLWSVPNSPSRLSAQARPMRSTLG
jgi:AraC-like DNA-binding protein